MSTPLTVAQATDLLRKNPGAYTTPDQLRALAAQLDANSTGRLTVLYSGPVADGIGADKVIKAMIAASEDVRVIDNSQAAKFLESKPFIAATAKAHGVLIGSLMDPTYRGPATDWLYHPTEGPWADASARFADLTKGEVRTIVSGASPNRVFGATELARVIANPEVTTIEGLPRKTLARVVAQEGLQPAFEMVSARAYQNEGALRVAVSGSGVPLRDERGLQIDSRGYFVGSAIEGKRPPTSDASYAMDSLRGSPKVQPGDARLQSAHVQIARDAGVEVLQRGLDLGRSSPVMRGLGVLGTAGLGVDAVDAGRKAAHLLDQGNLTGAQSEVMHFGGRAAGGALGGAAAVAAYAAAGGAALGPGGAMVAGLAGGTLGFVAGDRIMDAADRARIYSQRGSDGNDWKLDPKHPAQGWSRPLRRGEADPRGPVEKTSDPSDLPRAAPRLAQELDYKASSTAVELALARGPALQDPFRQPAERTGEAVRPGLAGANQPWVRDPQSHAWTRQTLAPATPQTHGMPVQRTVTASPEQTRQLERAAQATMAANIAQGPQAIAARYQSTYDQGGWKQHGPVPEAVRQAAQTPPGQLPASDGHTYTRGQDGQWTTPGGLGSLYRTNTAQGKVHAELEATHRQVQALQRMPMSAPAAAQPPAQQEPIPKIITHEQRITPTPGGISFAEAHKRRDEPEQISAGSLQTVGKLDASTLIKGSLSYRMHQANEQDLMRALSLAQTQDRERFKDEPIPLRPSLDRTQERVQERQLDPATVHEQPVPSAPEVKTPAPLRGEQTMAPVIHAPAPGHVSVASSTIPTSAHSSAPAPVQPIHAVEHRATAPEPSQPMADPAAASALAAAQAEAAASQAQLAEMRQQMARMQEQHRQNDLVLRNERDEREQREAAQVAQNHDTRQHTSATPGLDDPRHARNPHHALFNQLKERIPEASDRRLLEFTAACHANRITDEGLGRIHFDRQGGHMVFTSSWPPCAPAVVDLKNPSPDPSASIQAIQQTEQQRTMMSEMRAREAAQANQQQGPVLG